MSGRTRDQERRPRLSAGEATLRPGLRDVFAGSGYRRLWSARTVSQWADIFNFVALALLIYVALRWSRAGHGAAGGTRSGRQPTSR